MDDTTIDQAISRSFIARFNIKGCQPTDMCIQMFLLLLGNLHLERKKDQIFQLPTNIVGN